MKRRLCAWILGALMLIAAIGAAAQPAQAVYQLGDSPADFELTTSEGETVSLSGLLQDHKAVLLYFWFIGCGPSRNELAYLQATYEDYGGEAAILAVTPYDSDEDLLRYREITGFTFPMVSDSAGITDAFVDYGYPTCVLIDRNGVICYTECGSHNGSGTFRLLLQPFLQDQYEGPMLLASIPSMPMPVAPEIGALNAALNAEGSDLTFFCPSDCWPFQLSDDGSFLISPDGMPDGSRAMLQTLAETKTGDALSFEFCTSTEEGYDVLTVMIDWEIVKVFSGDNPWQTYTLTIPEPGTHVITFTYSKNDQFFDGEDRVALDEIELLHGKNAARALENNAVYPLTLTGYESSLTFARDSAREIVFDDPEGKIAANFGANAYYIIARETPPVHIRLGGDCDPDSALLVDINGNACALAHCRQDAEGFLFTAPPIDPATGWNALVIFPAVTDYQGQYTRAYVYFESEEAADAFCRDQAADPWTGETASPITWMYAE